MVTVKIAFFSWDSFYSNAVKIATGSKWSHVGIVSQEHSNGYTIHEALNKGLVKNFYSHEYMDTLVREGTMVIKEVNLRTTPAIFREVCERYEGLPYDWVSIINIGAFIILGKPILNLSGPRAVICSEYVARVLYECSNKGIDFSKEYNKRFDFVTPADMFESKFLR